MDDRDPTICSVLRACSGGNVTHHAEGQGSKFYSDDYIYVYDNPLVAVLLNPIHANFPWPLLWEEDAVDVQSDRGLKFGAKEVTTLRQIPVPEISTEQTVRFGILCALAVSKKAQFQSWAEAWLSKTYKAHEVTEWAEWEAAIQSEKAAAAAETGAWNAAQDVAGMEYLVGSGARPVLQGRRSGLLRGGCYAVWLRAYPVGGQDIRIAGAHVGSSSA